MMPMPLVGNRDLTVCVGKPQLTLRGALAEILAKCDRIPSVQERSMLERM